MSELHLKDILLSEGFPIVYEWHDEPGTVYPLHSHQHKVSFYVIRWSVTFHFDWAEKIITSGQRYDVPIKIEHSALVWPEGCDYVVWQMNENDA